MTASDAADRIAAGIRAFAAADALGAPWEGRPPQELADVSLTPVPLREDWPRGATSDDTASLLLVAGVLCEDRPAAVGQLGRRLLERLAAAATEIRGMGPSTLTAIERFRRDGSLRAPGGSTNGAAMRAPAIGWAEPDPEIRRALAEALTVPTHGTAEAVAAAAAIAAAASALLDGAPVDAAAAAAEREVPVPADWRPPPGGVSLDALETVAAVLHVLREATSVADATDRGIRLGGDTDTVAAIAAGLLAAHPAHAGERLPWIGEVVLPEPPLIERLARGLAERRGGGG